MGSLPLVFVAGADDGTTQIKDTVGNEYGKSKDSVGETRMAFTSHIEAAFDVCFENTLTSGTPHPSATTWEPH